MSSYGDERLSMYRRGAWDVVKLWSNLSRCWRYRVVVGGEDGPEFATLDEAKACVDACTRPDIAIEIGQKWREPFNGAVVEVVALTNTHVCFYYNAGTLSTYQVDYVKSYFKPIVPIPAVPEDVFPLWANVYEFGTDGRLRPAGDIDRYASDDRIAKIRIDGWDADGKLLGEVES